MSTYTRDTLVAVQPFTRQTDGEEVVIGVLETGIFLAIPSEAIEVLEYLAEGKSVGEAADIYQGRHGEVPDLNDFLGLMEENGIVNRLVDGLPGKHLVPAPQASRIRYHFSNFPQSLAIRLFSRPVIAGCIAIVALAFWAVIRNPSLMPRPGDLYFPDHRTLHWTIFIAVVYVTLFLHELGHLVAARAVGIKSRMGISNRLWYLVAETDLTGLWSVPKGKRYLPLLAGVLIDIVSAALLTLVLTVNGHWPALPPIVVRLIRAMMFSYVMRIAWQCFLFIRTDFYFVIANFFNCKNLLKDTEVLLRNLLALVIPAIRTADQSSIPASERAVVRAYAVIWLLGRIASLVLLFTVTVPIAGSYVRNLTSAFRIGYSANPSNFIDAFLLACYFLIPLAIGFWLWIIGLMRGERTRT